MNPRSRTLAVVAGAAVLAGAAGIGVAAGGNGATSSISRPVQGGPGGPGRFDVTALAEELGVSESRLQAALEAAGPGAGGPGTAPDDGGTVPDDGGTTPDDGGATPDDGGTTPDDGGTTPDGGGATPDDGAAAPGEPPARSDLAATLADELGLSVDKVEAALEATMPSGRPGGGPPPGSDGDGTPDDTNLS
jgi:hypothetical protein